MSSNQSEREALLKELGEIEFELFSSAQNEGAKASCQNDRKTFDIMREAQFAAWSNDSLASWYSDLVRAKTEGRNPFAEKYGYMMASTYPEGYYRIRHLLPQVSKKKAEMVERQISIYLRWEEDCKTVLPYFCSKGRPLYTSMDSEYVTSKETYMRGEMFTYSEETLACLENDLSLAIDAGRNFVMENYEAMARSYGYASAMECEKRLAKTAGQR